MARVAMRHRNCDRRLSGSPVLAWVYMHKACVLNRGTPLSTVRILSLGPLVAPRLRLCFRSVKPPKTGLAVSHSIHAAQKLLYSYLIHDVLA